jgi:O-antigen/teichoic acid export membrane protein
MVFYIRGQAETGFYSASYRLVEGVYTAAVVVCTTGLPRLSAGWSRDLRGWRGEWNRLLQTLMVITGVPALLFAALPDRIIGLIYGHAFIPAAASLKILGPAMLFVCLGNAYGYALLSVGREKSQLAITIVAFLINVAINLILIPSMGGPGAAIATLISAIGYIGLAKVLLNRTIKKHVVTIIIEGNTMVQTQRG